MGISEVTLYNLLRKKLGEQETYELVEFIHSEVKAELDTKPNVFMTKEDKMDLIEQSKAGKTDLTDRINNTSAEVAKVKSELIVWLVSVAVLQYILLMLTKKFF